MKINFHKKILSGLFLIAAVFSIHTSALVHAGNFPSDTRILKSASELDYPPFALVSPDGSADGFSVALLKAVVHEIGMEVEIPVGPWHEIKQQLTDGLLDVLPLVAYSPERDNIYDFSVPYLEMHGTVFVRRGDKTISSEADLKNKEVLVMRDDAAHEYAVKNNLSTKLYLADTYEEAFTDLAAGRHDAIVCQYLMGLQMIKKLGITNVASVGDITETSLKPSGRPVSGFSQKFCFAVQEGDTELLSRLNEGLAIVFANGAYERLYGKWFGPILPHQYFSPAKFIKYLLLVLIPILLAASLTWLWLLKKEVARKTRKLKLEIEERKGVEALLRESETKLHQAQKMGNIGSWRYDPKTRKAAWTPEMFRVFGMEPRPEAPDYEEHRNLIHPDDWELFDSSVSRAVSEGVGYDLELRIKYPDGETGYVNTICKAVRNEAGVVTELVGTAQDITARKKTLKMLEMYAETLEFTVAERTAVINRVQEQLLRQERLAAIGKLSGSVAHDIRNPLAVISNSVYFLKMIRNEQTDPRVVKHVDRMSKEINRANDIIADLLDFSRDRAPDFEDNDLHVLIKELLADFTLPADIRLRYDMTAELPLMSFDTQQIRRVFHNLVQNAIQAMPAGGDLLVSTRREKDSMVIRIEDSGTGISAEDLGKIFEPLFTTKSKGVGLGLTIVKDFVEKHGGTIDVASKPGIGTTFTVRLPINKNRGLMLDDLVKEKT